ncbi:MAG: hypothetical protein LBQ27_01090, partial [Clostridiales bacterium]|nr:hypothetical protein [Clostridiales bacterium]
LADEGKNPFSLDSKDPTENYQDFLGSEIRYNSLAKQNPDIAKTLFVQNEKDAATRLLAYKHLASK